MRISYLTQCPECSKLGQTSHLQYETDNGKIVCDGETAHEFSEMPAETPQVAEPDKSELARDFASSQNVPIETWTLEEEAALNEAMTHDPRPRDFGSQVAEGEDQAQESATAEIAAPGPSGAQQTAVCGMPGMVGAIVEAYRQTSETIVRPSVISEELWERMPLEVQRGASRVTDWSIPDGLRSPRVGLGEIVVLSDGSALACVKIDEKWVSAMQAEGENQTPPKNAAEYLQDIIDQGLLSWHMATPAAL